MEPQGQRVKSLTKDRSIAGLYDLERSLGSGHFAVVKLAKHVFTGEKVAVKVIDKTKLDDVAKAHLYQEVRCMKLVQHPNVVRLYEVIDTQTKLYLILEYGDGGDMYDHIMRHEGKGISEEKARHYFKQIVSAIDYCHKLHVVHRDLKPENVIFFKSQDIAKLTDFGFSNSFLPGEKLYTSCGSLAYSAPEILLGDSYDAPAVDVWSLGVILYMMVCGRGPFSHPSDSETLTMIMDCKYELPHELSDECKSLISKMLIRLPSKRATLETIVNDKWVNQGPVETVVSPPTPLISEIRISKDIHLHVLKKMELGKIAAKEEIQKSLEADKYDHVTATYFLLAERILKRRLGSTALHVKLAESHSYPYEYISRRPDEGENTSGSNDDSAGTSYEALDFQDPVVSDLTREQSQSDECLTESKSYDTYESKEAPVKTIPMRTRHSYPAAIYSKQKTKSTPNLLNEITEENESELEDSPRNSPHLRKHSSQRRHKYHTCRLSPIHSRRSSCSSSDDDEFHMLKDRRLFSGQLLANLSNQNTSHANTSAQSDSGKKEKSKGNNAKEIEDSLTEKILSLCDYEDPSVLSNLLVPSLNLKLGGFRYFPKKYGRHLSDTNLTTYSACLQLALAKKDFKNENNQNEETSGKKKQIKCSSDSNLVSMLYNMRNISSMNDICKLRKRNRNSSKNSSNLSLTSPIEEEPHLDFPGKTVNGHEKDLQFSDILSEIENDCIDSNIDEDNEELVNINNIDLISTEQLSSCHSKEQFRTTIEIDCNVAKPIPKRVTTTYATTHAVQLAPSKKYGSVCCSLV